MSISLFIFKKTSVIYNGMNNLSFKQVSSVFSSNLPSFKYIYFFIDILFPDNYY